jgi:NAD(P)H-dependent FMN reductase
MNESIRVAVLVGSLRRGSFSRKIAQALMARAPRSMACQVVEIGDLALYNEDFDHGTPPAAWSRFRSDVRKSDAVLFVTPEYNRSIPGCLKNAIDVGSRPQGKSVFDGTPTAVVSVTPYKLGAFGANQALRQTFVFLNMPVMQQPEVYIGKVGEVLDEDGQVRDQESAKLLQHFMSAFERWVTTIRAAGKPRDFEAFRADGSLTSAGE